MVHAWWLRSAATASYPPARDLQTVFACIRFRREAYFAAICGKVRQRGRFCGSKEALKQLR
jgi:hypothetical protein